MRRIMLNLLAMFSLLLLLGACGDGDPSSGAPGVNQSAGTGSDDASTDNVQRIVRLVTEFPSDAPDDAATIRSAEIIGDRLRVVVDHPGGCEPHDYALYASRSIVDADPPRVTLLLTHDAHGDKCEALLTKTLDFDIVPLRKFLRSVGGSGEAHLLDIHGPGLSPAFKPPPQFVP